LRQTQALSSAISVLLSEIRTAEAARIALDASIDPAPQPQTSPARFEGDGNH
jgi:hypothetical protein